MFASLSSPSVRVPDSLLPLWERLESTVWLAGFWCGLVTAALALVIVTLLVLICKKP